MEIPDRRSPFQCFSGVQCDVCAFFFFISGVHARSIVTSSQLTWLQFALACWWINFNCSFSFCSILFIFIPYFLNSFSQNLGWLTGSHRTIPTGWVCFRVLVASEFRSSVARTHGSITSHALSFHIICHHVSSIFYLELSQPALSQNNHNKSAGGQIFCNQSGTVVIGSGLGFQVWKSSFLFLLGIGSVRFGYRCGFAVWFQLTSFTDYRPTDRPIKMHPETGWFGWYRFVILGKMVISTATVHSGFTAASCICMRLDWNCNFLDRARASAMLISSGSLFSNLHEREYVFCCWVAGLWRGTVRSIHPPASGRSFWFNLHGWKGLECIFTLMHCLHRSAHIHDDNQ